MSCGHAVTPESLTLWCRMQLDEVACVFKNSFQIYYTFNESKVCFLKRKVLALQYMSLLDASVFDNVKYLTFAIKTFYFV